MKKILFLLMSIALSFNIQSQNCPGYSNTVSSTSESCGDQIYYFEVNNTSCQGEIIFTVSADYGIFGEDIGWSITSNLTSNVIASGLGSDNGSFSQVYNIDPNVEGQIFTITTTDVSLGFIAGGYVEIIQNGNILMNMNGAGSSIFGPAVSISSATITLTTPSGPVTSTAQSCRKFAIPLTLQNNNFCKPISISIPWEIKCDVTNAILSSGTKDITVEPKVASSASDVVDITWDVNSCSWEVSPQNDCDSLDIGTIFTISPEPNSSAAIACGNISQDFEVTYIGMPNGLNCCLTGGPLEPIVYSSDNSSDPFIPKGSPFGGINNSAYAQLPGSNVGGNAISLTLTISMTGYSFPNSSNLFGDYWVTVYVDGNPIYDDNFPESATNFNQTFTLADLPSGYDQSSVVEVYIYPNQLGGVSYIPNANNLLLDQWTATDISLSLNVEFTEQAPTPVNCSFNLSKVTSCCTPNSVSDVNTDDITELSTWLNDIENSNSSCFVYSSTVPVAGTVLPDSILPTGIYDTCAAVEQSVSVYAYCDVNGNGVVDNGDTYTLVSTYSLSLPTPESPDLTLSANPDTLIFGESSELSALGEGAIDWETFGQGETQTVSPEITTTYSATIIDSLGCISTQEVTVYVLFENIEMKVPDAFSPNGDGINDVFKIVNADDFKTIEMKIYNRWGELIHTGYDSSHAWDGNYKLAAQDVDSYVYYIKASTLSGEEFIVSGTVSLLR